MRGGQLEREGSLGVVELDRSARSCGDTACLYHPVEITGGRRGFVRRYRGIRPRPARARL